jgi:hypothetical protein
LHDLPSMTQAAALIQVRGEQSLWQAINGRLPH